MSLVQKLTGHIWVISPEVNKLQLVCFGGVFGGFFGLCIQDLNPRESAPVAPPPNQYPLLSLMDGGNGCSRWPPHPGPCTWARLAAVFRHLPAFLCLGASGTHSADRSTETLTLCQVPPTGGS